MPLRCLCGAIMARDSAQCEPCYLHEMWGMCRSQASQNFGMPRVSRVVPVVGLKHARTLGWVWAVPLGPHLGPMLSSPHVPCILSLLHASQSDAQSDAQSGFTQAPMLALWTHSGYLGHTVGFLFYVTTTLLHFREKSCTFYSTITFV